MARSRTLNDLLNRLVYRIWLWRFRRDIRLRQERWYDGDLN